MSLSRRHRRWILGIETVCLLALAAWILFGIGELNDPLGWSVAIAIIGAGDLATVLLMQRLAPTRITLEPGEAAVRLGSALGDFNRDGYGRVLVRGERWRARCHGLKPISAGDEVRVVARQGLTLVVERAN
jgi:membrane protein implicated in regulation of membrane protease activity